MWIIHSTDYIEGDTIFAFPTKAQAEEAFALVGCDPDNYEIAETHQQEILDLLKAGYFLWRILFGADWNAREPFRAEKKEAPTWFDNPKNTMRWHWSSPIGQGRGYYEFYIWAKTKKSAIAQSKQQLQADDPRTWEAQGLREFRREWDVKE